MCTWPDMAAAGSGGGSQPSISAFFPSSKKEEEDAFEKHAREDSMFQTSHLENDPCLLCSGRKKRTRSANKPPTNSKKSVSAFKKPRQDDKPAKIVMYGAKKIFCTVLLAEGVSKMTDRAVVKFITARGFCTPDELAYLQRAVESRTTAGWREKCIESIKKHGVFELMKAPKKYTARMTLADLRPFPPELLEDCLLDRRKLYSGRKSYLPTAESPLTRKVRAAFLWQRKLGNTLRMRAMRKVAQRVAGSWLAHLKATQAPPEEISLAEQHFAVLQDVKSTAWRAWVHRKLRFSYRAGNSKTEKSPPLETRTKWMAIAAAQLALLIKKHPGITKMGIVNSDESSLQFALRFTRTWHPVGDVLAVENICGGDKRCLTVTPAITAAGKQLPIQVLNSGANAETFAAKMTGALSDEEAVTAGNCLKFHVSSGKKHWQTTETWKQYVNDVIAPHLEAIRALQPGAKLVWLVDCASTHTNPKFLTYMKETHPDILMLFVPPNMTHLAQPLDLNYQRAFKSSVRRQLADWIDSNTPVEGTMSVDDAKTSMKNLFKTATILPKVIGEFLPTTFAELSAKRVSGSSELSLCAAWRKSPYWCAMHPQEPDKWDASFTDGELGLMMKEAVQDPLSFLDAHGAKAETFFVDNIRRGRQRLRLELDALFPPAPADQVDLLTATPKQVKDACKAAGMSIACSVAHQTRRLKQFYDKDLLVEERLYLFPVVHLRKMCHDSKIINLAAGASRSACVSALREAIAADEQLAKHHKILFADEVADECEEMKHSCMLLFDEDAGVDGAVECSEAPSSESDEEYLGE